MEVNVKELRKEMIDHDFQTISALSAKSGVDRNILSKVLRQQIKPSAGVMEKLITTLELSGARAGEIFFADKLT